MYRPIGGCDFVEPPLHGDDGMAFWSADCDPMVLVAEARRAPSGDTDTFDLLHLPVSATAVRARDGIEYLLLSDGMRRLRLELHGDSAVDGPVRLTFRHAGLRPLPLKILAFRRLSALWRLRRLPQALYPVDPIVNRRVRALQAYDAYCHGASQREIAAAVFGPLMVDAQSFDSARKRVVRLLDLAERRIAIGRRRFFGAA